MAQQNGNGGSNGRNVALPDENRPSWRPQDENNGRRARRNLDEGDDDRYMRGHWEDRADRRYEREDDYRSSERYGQGQSGYGAGRIEGDRSYQSRNQAYSGSVEDRHRNTPSTDDRWTGRGQESWGRGYDDERDRQRNLGTGGSMNTGYQGWRGDERWRDDERGYGGMPGSMAGGMQRGEHTGYTYGGGHRGKGPASYKRSDERIREMICEALTEHDSIDATYIEVTVKEGEVTLAGTVVDRRQKRLAEDIVEQIGGVKDVQNQIRTSDRKQEKPEGEAKRRS